MRCQIVSSFIIMLLVAACGGSSTSSNAAACGESAQKLVQLASQNDVSAVDTQVGELLSSCPIDSGLGADYHSTIVSVSSFYIRNNQYDKGIDSVKKIYTLSPYSSGSFRDQMLYSAYLIHIYSAKADFIAKNSKQAGIEVMKDYEKNALATRIPEDRSALIYTLLPSYDKRYSLGDISSELLNGYVTVLNKITDGRPDYSKAISLAQKLNDDKSVGKLQGQQQTLYAAMSESNSLYPKSESPVNYENEISSAELISKRLEEKNYNSLSKTWSNRAQSFRLGKALTENDKAVAARIESDNRELQAQRAAENQQFMSSLMGVASGAAVAYASGGDVSDAVNNGLADTAVNNSNNPELMQSVRSAMTTSTQSNLTGNSTSTPAASPDCNRSTPSGFISCCKAMNGTMFPPKMYSDGTTGYGCKMEGGTRRGCQYRGDTLIPNSCAIAD